MLGRVLLKEEEMDEGGFWVDKGLNGGEEKNEAV